ncbi:MAG TPA: DUF2336 domain-containing protein [Caulobacteraceae bacterium]|jgi:uncharacterized protein (DUF2336 family)
MTTRAMRLSEMDIRRLVKGDSVDERAAAAHKLCRAVEHASLTEDDRAAAQGIIRVLASDTAELVRRALAVTLKTSSLLPRDVAMRLARDLESVALPIINASPVFTDEDLVEIVKSGAVTRQIAVAERESLSKQVTAAVAVYGAEPAVAAACANDNARFAEASLQRAIDRFARSEDVTRAIAYRKQLPITISERLVDIVSDSVRQHLVEHHALKLDTAMRLTSVARERITVDLVDQAAVTDDYASFAQHLNQNGRLNASLLLRAMARGQMLFFEHALAELSGVPHERTWLMVHDAGPLGFRAIYERAGLPTRLFPAFRSAIDCWRAVEGEGGPLDRDLFQERVLQRFLTSQPYASREDLNYLLERIDRSAPDAGKPVRVLEHANAA